MKKILMCEVLKDNEELGKVLDEWNEMYEYRILMDDNKKLFREDLQDDSADMIEVDIEYIIRFYIDEIENKSSHEYDLHNINEKMIAECFIDDYKILIKNN